MGRYFLLAALMGASPTPVEPEEHYTQVVFKCNEQVYPTRYVFKTETKTVIIITGTCLNV